MNAPAPLSHHPLGPSSWPMVAECPDFEGESDVDDIDATAVAIEEGEIVAPEEDEDDTATGKAKPPEDKTPRGRGTLQHAAYAAMLGRFPSDIVQAALAPLSSRERADVMWAVERTLEIVASHGWSPADVRVEQRTTLLDAGFKVVYFGTKDADCGPLVFDLKSGWERNYFPQLVGYVLPDLEEEGGGRKFAYLIYSRLRRHTQHVIDLPTAQTVGYGILRRRTADVRPPKPCQYCGICAKKKTCVAINAIVSHVVNLREDWPSAALQLDQAHVSRMTRDPVMLGKARWLWKAYLEKWGESIEWASKALAEHGIAPLGFKISPRKGAKSVAKVMGAVTALERAGVPRDALDAALKTSFGALVAVYYEYLGGTKKAAEETVERILRDAGALTIGEAGITLRREPDGESMLAEETLKK